MYQLTETVYIGRRGVTMMMRMIFWKRESAQPQRIAERGW